MTDTQQAIMAATDRQLLDFYHNFDLLVGMANQALVANAKIIRANDNLKEAAALQIQEYRERTFYQLVQEINTRGLNVE